MVFYCERAAGFCNDVGYQDDSYFNALVRMFEQALMIIAQLSGSCSNSLIARLDKVRTMSHNFGYGVGDDMDSLLGIREKVTPSRRRADRFALRRLAETSRCFNSGSSPSNSAPGKTHAETGLRLQDPPVTVLPRSE
jgi:hypothetical protein